jgi:precorrin-6B methylase 2
MLKEDWKAMPLDELVALEQDAMRYRWIRQNFDAIEFARDGSRLRVANGDAPEMLDPLIDELMEPNISS